MIAAITSSLAAVRAFGGVPGARTDAAGSRYGRRAGAGGASSRSGPAPRARAGERLGRLDSGGRLAGEALDRVLGAGQFVEQVDVERVDSARRRSVARCRPPGCRTPSRRPCDLRRHHGIDDGVLRVEAEVAERAELAVVAGCGRALRRRLGQLGAEQVGVQLAQTRADAVRRGLGDDEQREHEPDRREDDGEPAGADLRRTARSSIQPIDAAARGEAPAPVRRLAAARRRRGRAR